ncbi:MAG: cystathionine gamma-synthase [Vampirovibrionales bacterium]|nr:cystathionine gamma-synthase [Vampirovibrionales bacterium]
MTSDSGCNNQKSLHDIAKQKLANAKTATLAARAALETDPVHGAVMPPLYLSTNFTFDGYKGKRQYDYTRSGNPTRDAVGDAIAKLEGGVGAVMTTTGMAALDLLFHYLEPGDLIFAPHDCYGGTHRLLQQKANRGYYRVKFIDQTDLAAFEKALSEEAPKLILIETPSNPLLRLTDISAVCHLAQKYSTPDGPDQKGKKILVAADNTFLSPALQQPLSLGADIVVHSTTKYLNGHGDVVGGALVSKTPELHQFFTYWANCIGNTGSPFDSYLTLRGLRTLNVRLKEQESNTRKVVDLLNTHPAVSKVYYPGLKSHPGHEIARKQQSGFGAMLSFELAGGEAEIRAFLENLTYFSLAESLGGVESLVAHPATMTHAGMDPDARRAAGINDQLLRLSIGLEDAEDLLADLESALQAAQAKAGSLKASDIIRKELIPA